MEDGSGGSCSGKIVPEDLMEDREYVRRNEDRDLDDRDMVREEEILAQDNVKRHTGGFQVVNTIVRCLLLIAVVFVLINLLIRAFA